VKTELDFGDHLEWISVERDPILYELYNGVVGILYGWLNFRKKYYVFVCLILIYFLFLFKLCSCLEFDLTLDLNPRVILLLVVLIIYLSFISSSLQIVSLSEPRRIVLASDLLFHCVKFLVIEYIRPSPDIPALRMNIFNPAILTV
jgi:hypothetical protein